MTVDVILPALDEERALPALLAALPAGYRAIVVDNGSTDGTAAVAAAGGALVVHESRRGFGSACRAGLVAASAHVVCFMDADGSFDPRDLPRVADPVLRGDADLVLAARRAAPGAWPVHARVANRVLAYELRRRLGLPLHDLGPMRAARRDDLLALGIEDRRSGWPLEMVVLAARAGWRIDETTVAYAPRLGRSKVTGTVRGTATAVADMDRVLRRHTSVLTPRPARVAR
jgi:glycosyltransferase involved in cell wall biosynthesis